MMAFARRGQQVVQGFRAGAGPGGRLCIPGGHLRQNAWFVADENVPGEERIVEVEWVTVAVLLWGEVHSERARSSAGGLGVKLVVDLGHDGMRYGLIPASRRVTLD